jgi:hypothetical protein
MCCNDFNIDRANLEPHTIELALLFLVNDKSGNGVFKLTPHMPEALEKSYFKNMEFVLPRMVQKWHNTIDFMNSK